ncbi:hypothetical protein VTK73DRAFT_4758 [Phialemonium thermophilum]|uniref:Auxin efflux carrier n=1 Tax=Phialemonium thermophilum TaxID=223376 RepID=A0ABR3V6H2_9PEZI
MAPAGLVETFVGAIQASVSVLLVMTYGGVAAWMRLLDRGTTTAVSKICVRLFLPALLVTKIGAQLHADSAARYLAILLWAAACHLASYLVGAFGRRVLRMPDWTTVALMFNNTTSYPLLLISALEETGILASLTGAGESTSDAVDRAKAYFLVFSTVCNCLTFAVGPRLIDTEAAPSSGQDGDEDDDNNDRENENDGESEDDEESAIGNERTDALVLCWAQHQTPSSRRSTETTYTRRPNRRVRTRTRRRRRQNRAPGSSPRSGGGDAVRGRGGGCAS